MPLPGRGRQEDRLGWSLGASAGMHAALFGAVIVSGTLDPDAAPPLQPSVMVVEPLYAMPQDPRQLPDRPTAAPPPEAGDRGDEVQPPDSPDAMTLPDPLAKKEEGEEREERDKAERDRRKREELERLANLERGDRDQAPTAEDAVAPPDWATWNPSGNANADPILGRYVALVRDHVQKRWHVVDRSVVKNTPDFFVVVSVLIDRDGTIVEHEVSHPSGSRQFDAWAKRAVQQSKVLPRPDDKVWARLSEGRYEQVGVDIQFAGKDVSLQ